MKPSDPRQSEVGSPIMDGWRTGTKMHDIGIAHYYLNGRSLCHRWITTRLDRPAKDTDQRCPQCSERRP